MSTGRPPGVAVQLAADRRAASRAWPRSRAAGGSCRQSRRFSGSIASRLGVARRSPAGTSQESMISRWSFFRSSRPSMKPRRRASRAARDGSAGPPACRSRSGVRTRPAPKWCSQTRFTITRAVSGFAGSTMARASSSRPLPVLEGLAALGPAMDPRNCRGTSSAFVGGVAAHEDAGVRWWLGRSSRITRVRRGAGVPSLIQRSISFWSLPELDLALLVEEPASVGDGSGRHAGRGVGAVEDLPQGLRGPRRRGRGAPGSRLHAARFHVRVRTSPRSLP